MSTRFSIAALQYVIGGISAIGGVSTKAIADFAKGIDNAVARIAIQVGANALSEGAEEALQTILEPYLMNIAVGFDVNAAEDIDWEEVVYSGFLGMATSIAMEGGTTTLDSTGMSRLSTDIVRDGQIDSLLVYARTLSQIDPECFSAVSEIAALTSTDSGPFRVKQLLQALSDADVNIDNLPLWSTSQTSTAGDDTATALSNDTAQSNTTLPPINVPSLDLPSIEAPSLDLSSVSSPNIPSTSSTQGFSTNESGIEGKFDKPSENRQQPSQSDPEDAESMEAFKAGVEEKRYVPKSQESTGKVDNQNAQRYNSGGASDMQAEEQPLSDEEQFEQYAAVLQELAPASFEEFVSSLLPSNLNGTAHTENQLMKNAIDLERMERKKSTQKVEPMPKKQLHRIIKAFQRCGGVVQMGEETDAYLNEKQVEGITYNEKTVVLKRRSGRAAVFEEFIHTRQCKTGKFDGTYKSRLICEIEAQEKLLKWQAVYRLTTAEIELTKANLAGYQKELENLLKESD